MFRNMKSIESNARCCIILFNFGEEVATDTPKTEAAEHVVRYLGLDKTAG